MQNTVRRDSFMEAVAERLWELLVYVIPSPVAFGQYILSSEEQVQQNDIFMFIMI